MAKEYIEREAAKKEFSLRFGGVSHAVIANRILDEIPTADVVEVVRCKECKYRANGWSNASFCGKRVGGMSATAELKDDDFCSYGERRDRQ